MLAAIFQLPAQSAVCTGRGSLEEVGNSAAKRLNAVFFHGAILVCEQEGGYG